MAVEKGLEFLIKRGDGGGPETFTAFAGLRSKSLDINNEDVDVTNDDSTSRFRELLSEAGVSSIDFSGSGVIKAGAELKAAVPVAMAGTVENYEVTIPGVGVFTGAFKVKMSFAGEYNGEATWNMSFASAGVITFVVES